MTATSKGTRSTCRRAQRWTFMLMIGFVTLLFFKNGEAAAEFVRRGTETCLYRLIPSLFPFLVLSSLLTSSELDTLLGKTLARPLSALLGVGYESACAVLLGLICGFPVGARCACELLKNGKVERRECERVLATCSIPSPAFLVSVVGSEMLGSRALGWRLWGVCMASALLVGVALRVLSPLPQRKARLSGHSDTQKQTRICSSVCAAICDGARGMLTVCAFVIFFSAFLGALDELLTALPISSAQGAVIYAFFELTAGIGAISALPCPAAPALCAMAAGWSGLSVHLQTISICARPDVRFTPYVLSHAARALLCFLLSGVVL